MLKQQLVGLDFGDVEHVVDHPEQALSGEFNFFKKTPDVYKYSADAIKINFPELRIDHIDYKIIFELKIDRNYKNNEFIVDTQENIFVFNSIFKKPITYKTLNESIEVFNLNKEKVKDAF